MHRALRHHPVIPSLRHPPHAFTLVELIVVITIIVILIALLAPALERSLQTVERVRCGANEHLHFQALYHYATANRKQLPPLNDGDRHDQRAGQWTYLFRYNVSGKEWWNLGYLWRDGYATSGPSFYCPGNQHPAFRYPDYASPVFPSYNGTWDSPTTTATGSTAIRLSYNFNPIATSLTDRTHRYRKFGDLNGRAIVVVDLMVGATAEGLGLGHAELGGFNVARGDGAVGFVVDPTIIRDVKSNKTYASGTAAADYLYWDSILDRLARGRD